MNRAANADPRNVTLLGLLGGYLTSSGLYAEALALYDRGLELSPLNESLLRAKAMNLHAWTGDAAAAIAILDLTPEELRDRTSRFFALRAPWREGLGDFAGAISDHEHCRAVIAAGFSDRTGPRAVALNSLYEIGRIEARRGNAARAQACFDEAMSESDQLRVNLSRLVARVRGLILARRGQAAEALAAIPVDAVLPETPVAVTWRPEKAQVFARLGHVDQAISELQAIADAGLLVGYGWRANPEFEPLRADARFRKLLAAAEARANAQPR